MDLKDVKRTEKNSKQVNIRITRGMKNFIDSEKISVSKVFHLACKELGFKEEKQ